MGGIASAACGSKCSRHYTPVPSKIADVEGSLLTSPQRARILSTRGNTSGLPPLESEEPSQRLKCARCCCIFTCFLIIVVIGIIFSWSYTLEDLNEKWLFYLNSPPPFAVSSTDELLKRSRELAFNVSHLVNHSSIPPSLDLVCSGGGMMSMYFLGVHQVLESLQALKLTSIARMAGASGGAETALRLALGPSRRTVEQNLALAQLQLDFSDKFSWMMVTFTLDHLWRSLGQWLFRNETTGTLLRLNGRVRTSITEFSPWPQNVLVDKYINPHQAYRAFIFTGSTSLMPDAIRDLQMDYDGKLAMDGGLTDCEPHFKDMARSQLVVNLLNVDMPGKWSLIAGRFNVADALSAIRKGQDDIVALLLSGKQESASGALRIRDERPTWAHFNCHGQEISETMNALHKMAFTFGVLFVLICPCLSCWLLFRKK